MRGISWLAEKRSASQEGLCSMDLHAVCYVNHSSRTPMPDFRLRNTKQSRTVSAPTQMQDSTAPNNIPFHWIRGPINPFLKNQFSISHCS
jgi:hypothetical protein